ncbi:MAG: ABC-2 family transporter protein [Lachnospiraceae bacterium]|nr:ABC-2 family transporter protein [Lachnospiraceae bacterium]
MDTIKLYIHSMRMLIKAQLEYPASFLMQTFAQLIMEGGEMLAVILLVNRFERLNEWEAGDLYFFFGMMSVTFYLMEVFCRGITGNFPYLIRTGGLDTILSRPRGVLTQVMCSAADPRRITCIAVGTVALVIGSSLSHVQWSFAKALLLVEAILAGGLLIIGLFLIEAIFCIHSVKSIELVNALTYGGRSACQYPIDTFPGPLRILFTVVAPFALTLHVPGSMILGKPLFGWPMWAAFVTPLSGALFFAFMWVLFQKAVRFYRSCGS